MKRLLKFFLIFILSICGVLIAATAILHFVNLNPYRDRIASLTTKAIGRQVNINGDIDINLFPRPEVILNDISIANAKWGTEPVMVSVGHVDATISFLSFFSDPIIIRVVRLNDIAVLLERNDQQLGNWIMGTPTPISDTKEEKTPRTTERTVGLPVMVDLAEFSNVAVTVRSPERSDQTYRISSLNLQPDESGSLILKSSGDLLGYPLKLDCKITSRMSVIQDEAVNIELQASFGDAELTGQFSTSRLVPFADLQGTFSIAIQDIQKALKKAEIEAPLTGPLTADATVSIDRSVYKAIVDAEVEGITVNVNGSYTDKKVVLSSKLAPLRHAGELFDIQGLSTEALTLKAKVTQSDAGNLNIEDFQADVGQNRLTAQGRVNTSSDASLSLTLSSPDLNTLLESLPKIDLKAKASVQNSAEKIAVSDLVVTFDKSDINGEIAMLKGENSKIIANLASKMLDMRPFSKPSEPGDAVKQTPLPDDAKNPPEDEAATKSQYVFKNTPLQLAPLQTVEADAKLAVNHFFYDFIELKHVVIDGSVHGGQVDAKFKYDSADWGHAAGKIDLKTQGEKATVDTLFSLSDFRSNFFKAEGIRPSEIPPISVSIELKASGASPRELASVVNGRILLTQGSGKIKKNILGMVAGDVFTQLSSALNPYAKNEEFSNWDCALVSANIVDGLANIDRMLLQVQEVLIVGGGDIDLKTEKLNIEFNTKPREGIGVGADMFVSPFVKLTGTLASPGVGLDTEGTLLTGGAAVVTGGLSLLVKRLFDRATAEGDQCEKVSEAAGEHISYDF